MYDEAVDDFLLTLNLFYWFVTSKMIKKLFTALYADKNILYFDEDFGNVVFSCNKMDILIALTLKIIILMKMILVLIFMTDF